MLIYNVTLNVDSSIDAEWLVWMRQVHIPEVMETKMFVKYAILRLMTEDEQATGTTYAVQYFAETIEKYEQYKQKYAPRLQARHQQRYGNKVLAFRTLLEELT